MSPSCLQFVSILSLFKFNDNIEQVFILFLVSLSRTGLYKYPNVVSLLVCPSHLRISSIGNPFAFILEATVLRIQCVYFNSPCFHPNFFSARASRCSKLFLLKRFPVSSEKRNSVRTFLFLLIRCKISIALSVKSNSRYPAELSDLT